MPFRTQYIALANPSWPPTQARLNTIYSTIARPIRNPNAADKAVVLRVLNQELLAFDINYAVHTATQVAFDNWHARTIGALMAVPFNWSDAMGGHHTTLTLGAAQKFLNLGLKDWWALSPNGTNPTTVTTVLHGTLDKIVYGCTSRFCGPLPSLHGPGGLLHSYIYCLTMADYNTYQTHLAALAHRLAVAFNLGTPIKRIEVEQVLWGWV